jgi:hypothetical protein
VLAWRLPVKGSTQFELPLVAHLKVLKHHVQAQAVLQQLPLDQQIVARVIAAYRWTRM